MVATGQGAGGGLQRDGRVEAGGLDPSGNTWVEQHQITAPDGSGRKYPLLKLATQIIFHKMNLIYK